MKNKILLLADEKVRKWIIDNLEVAVGDVPTAGVTYDKEEKKFKMVVNENFFSSLTNEQARALIDHELAHIYRGDIFKEDGNQMLWNIVYDAIINTESKHKETFREMGGIIYDNLMESFNLPPLQITTEREIYDRLQEENKNKNENGIQGNSEGESIENLHPLDQVIPVKLDVKEKIKVAKKLKDLQDAVGKESNLIESGGGKGDRKSYLVKEEKSIIIKILNLLEKAGNKFTCKRSYRREGRVEGLRGIHSKRVGKIILIVDVSGSVANLIEKFLQIANYLIHRKWVVKFATFSDGFVLYPNLPRNKYDIQDGGTTLFRGAVEHLNCNDYDAAIVVTDGELFDMDCLDELKVKHPIIWVLSYKNKNFINKISQFENHQIEILEQNER